MKNIRSLLIMVFTAVAFSTAHAQVKKPNPLIDSSRTIFKVNFPKGKSSTRLNAYMLGVEHPVTFIVNIKRGKNIKADIKEMGEPGNIRINQILLPDGTSDGPFSKTLNFPVKRKGVYKIIVGGSNMQADDWKGGFTMHITVK